MIETMRDRRARERYDDAVRAERRARIAAAPALRRRARRGNAAVRLAVVAMIVVAVVAGALAGWGFTTSDDDPSAAVDAADAAVTAMLTPDPNDADGYIDAIVDASTGVQRARFEQGRDALTAYVSSLPVRPDGRVVSAGAESIGDDETVVLLVAQATDPTLIGGGSDDQRVTVRITMTRDGDRWLVADTEAI